MYFRDDVLYIDNTMYNGVPGHWSAWIVDQEGKTTQWGIIPSKYKVITKFHSLYFFIWREKIIDVLCQLSFQDVVFWILDLFLEN